MITKRQFSLVTSLFLMTGAGAQTCDCKKNYDWVKKTFEENDAGFSHVLKLKGEEAYAAHNKTIMARVQEVKTLTACTPLLYEWLKFFRSGHIAIRLTAPQQEQPKQSAPHFGDWESRKIKTGDFKKYLDRKDSAGYEGIWETGPYKIGIKKEADQYTGIIVESGAETWSSGQVKLKFSIADDETKAIFYMRDHSPVESGTVTLIGKNHLQIGDFTLKRIYPVLVEEEKYVRYFKAMQAEQPYLEQLNVNTLYLRLPSFGEVYKKMIDSVLTSNRSLLLSTPNLVIDIRNNGGGSDVTYSEIMPYLYTNPVREVGVEYLSTQLNNQRMLDFINDPAYGLNEEDKKWARKAYDQLEKKRGQFVNLNEEVVSIGKFDTVYRYPRNVGVIINEANGSSAEQFLLEARQSKKVKFFGVSTFGVLDFSNMYFVDSPCREFQLGYALSRSMRLPGFTIDEKGIQPDYYMDKSIPPYGWTDFVNGILNDEEVAR